MSNLLSLSPEVDFSGLEPLETFFSKPGFKPASFQAAHFVLLHEAKASHYVEHCFLPGPGISVPPGESLEIASSPSAPRNDTREKALRNGDSLWDFAISITSFLFLLMFINVILFRRFL